MRGKGARLKDLDISARLGADIREIWRVTSAMIGTSPSETITIEQYWILRLLYDSGPKPIKDIATEIGITHSPMTIAVKRLVQRKFLRKERETADERVVTVYLTDNGRRLFEKWRAGRRRALQQFFNSLSGREKRVLLELLDQLIQAQKRSERIGTLARL